MIRAAIDLGTNSAKVLVGRVRGRRVVPVFERLVNVRLGEGLGQRGLLSDAAMDRSARAIRSLAALARRHGAGDIRAAGTQALRVARNSDAFVLRVRKETGLWLRILSGDEEARLSYQGATGGSTARTIVGIEIGGGSTQITTGTPGKLENAWSLPIGAVALSERLVKGDPPTGAELMALSQAVERELGRIPARLQAEGALYGIGGTVSTILRVLKSGPPGAPAAQEAVLPLGTISALAVHLACHATRERERMGIERGRADIIVAGAWILLGAMRQVGARELHASRAGLRHGMLLESSQSWDRPRLSGPP
jgi:exopolyphosphatase/guanosine-5'-triphosphate,3'-diphosphate pyrophosphatase